MFDQYVSSPSDATHLAVGTRERTTDDRLPAYHALSGKPDNAIREGRIAAISRKHYIASSKGMNSMLRKLYTGIWQSLNTNLLTISNNPELFFIRPNAHVEFF